MAPGAWVGGLEVVFDWAIDADGWPGPGGAPAGPGGAPAGPGGAPAGEVWLGPLGLLDRLELELGLGRVHAAPLERAVELARSLASREGFWSRSLAVDGLATAERLLAEHDALRLWGWRGEPASERLAALWSATRAVRPGIPERLDRVSAALARRRTELAIVRMVEPAAALPPLWQRVLEGLQRAGVRIVQTPLPRVRSPGDLGAARGASFAASFTPAGDGSLQLVRPQGVLAAAEEVAACLAACPELPGVVVIGPDGVLDAALARHGLPRVGARIPAPGTAALPRLCIEAAFQPMDAAALHALLCVDPGPVPRRIAWRLAGALSRFPGRGSAEWQGALAGGLAASDEDSRAAVAARLAALLEPAAERTQALSSDQLAARMRALADWARGRLAAAPSLAGVIETAERLVAAARLGGEPLGLAALRGLLGRLEEADARGAPAELGLAAIAGPGALLGSPRVVIWWGFERERAPRAPRPRLTAAERAALAARGVTAPDAGAMMAHEARRWRRPLELAAEALVLVCPRTDEVGEPAHPHPLWDELVAVMPEPALAARLHSAQMMLPASGAAGARITARRVRAEPRTRPAPFERVRAPRPLGLLERDSASSIEVLLGCSLAYVLRYAADLRPGLWVPAAQPDPLAFGELLHYVLARVFAGGALPAAAAAARAEAIVDAELPRLAETFLLPDHQAERAAVRRAIALSARAVADCIARSGATLRGVEVMLEGQIGPATLASRADLLLADPDHVIDFKWGGSRQRDALSAGAAVQLALYAGLARRGPDLPGVAYLLARTQRLVAARGTGLPDASEPTAYTAADMLRAAEAALAQRLRELSAGELVAPGAIAEAPASRLDGGALRVQPACGYCALDGLCGRRGRA
jgi:hypothetical protein